MWHSITLRALLKRAWRNGACLPIKWSGLRQECYEPVQTRQGAPQLATGKRLADPSALEAKVQGQVVTGLSLPAACALSMTLNAGSLDFDAGELRQDFL